MVNSVIIFKNLKIILNELLLLLLLFSNIHVSDRIVHWKHIKRKYI